MNEIRQIKYFSDNIVHIISRPQKRYFTSNQQLNINSNSASLGFKIKKFGRAPKGGQDLNVSILSVKSLYFFYQ